MKKIVVLIALLNFAVSPSAMAISFNFEEIRAKASPNAEKGLSVAEDRTYDDEFNGGPGKPSAEFLGRGRILPAGILLSTQVGERIVSLFDKYHPQFQGVASTLIDIDSLSVGLTVSHLREMGEILDSAYAITDRERFEELANLIIPIAMDKGLLADVWNQPLAAPEDHGARLKEIVGDYFEALLTAKDAAAIDQATKLAQSQLASEISKLDQLFDALGDSLKSAVGKDADLIKKIDELIALMKATYSDVMELLAGEFSRVGEIVKKDPDYFFRPEVGDEV